MKSGFMPVSIAAYVERHLKANPGATRKEITSGLKEALRAYKSGERCSCGNPIWVIGSAVAGLACFTCITGEASPDCDLEIDEACEESPQANRLAEQ
jgi:hypothetical protein